MKIYECWTKIQYHFIAVTVLFIIMALCRLVIKDINMVYYLIYTGSGLVLTMSCFVVGIKHGFLWYYPMAAMFSLLMVLYISFSNDYPEIIVRVFLSGVTASLTMSAIGAIVRRIKKNNIDED